MATNQEIYSDLAVPPGEYLSEVAEEMGMSQAELARRMGRPVQVISEIANGIKSITPDTALQLEQVLGVPAHIWTGLEAEYQLTKARGEAAEQVEHETDLAVALPLPRNRETWMGKANAQTFGKGDGAAPFFRCRLAA